MKTPKPRFSSGIFIPLEECDDCGARFPESKEFCPACSKPNRGWKPTLNQKRKLSTLQEADEGVELVQDSDKELNL